MRDIIAKAETKQQEYEPIPADIHDAVCFAIYDVGTVVDERYKDNNGKPKQKHEVIITWEVTDVRDDFKQADGTTKNLPKAISEKYNLTLNCNKSGVPSKLRGMLESWRGKPFTEQELLGFSLKNIAGKPCRLHIMHEPKDGGGVWVNINTVLPAAKDKRDAKPENPVRLWGIGDPTDNVPKWIIKRASESKEWAQIADPVPPAPPVKEPEEEQDACPF